MIFGYIDIVSFSWVGSLFRQGFKKGLEEADIYDVLPENSSVKLSSELSR